ncbi:hypothetical protein [Saccharothrix sp. HUAS TT1]|uniref:hypothetical protein n=1 Tax=unclassified Saccharothrix TaxID=2593673 RepID=UPI00345C3F45
MTGRNVPRDEAAEGARGVGRRPARPRRRTPLGPYRVFWLTAVGAFVAAGLNAASLLDPDAPAWFGQAALAIMATIGVGHLLRAGLGRA